MNHVNPVIQSQITTLDADIAKHKEETQRLSKLVSGYQAKLSAIPVREQEITELVRDYEISKAHYSQLLGRIFRPRRPPSWKSGRKARSSKFWIRGRFRTSIAAEPMLINGGGRSLGG